MDDLNKTSETPSVTDRLISLVMEMSEEQQEALLEELELKLAKERRRHTRKPFITFVDFASQGRAYREFVQDISGGGVYIQTSRPFSLGQDVVLTFPFPDSQKHIKITGRIARVADTGIGVQFNMRSPLDELPVRSLLKML
jgi:Tfp pilus assembly protein PilZ